jgi:hypothetical protein
LLGKRGGVRPYGRRGGIRPYGRRGRRLVGGAAAAGTPNIGAAAAVPHGGSSLPPWPTTGAILTVVAHDDRLPRAPLPAADRWRSPCRRDARRLVAKSAKTSKGCIILQND